VEAVQSIPYRLAVPSFFPIIPVEIVFSPGQAVGITQL
jgi:hypothetical protein